MSFPYDQKPWRCVAVLAVFAVCAVLHTAAQEAENYGEVLNDPEITAAVRDELRLDPVVSVADIQVNTDGGNVTLKGAVSNMDAKIRAARLAKGVRGVYRVVNQLKVEAPWRLEDLALENDIRAALLEDPVVESGELQLAAESGIVRVEGQVETLPERNHIENVISSVRGVTEVVNEIDVAPLGTLSDEEIRGEILRALRFDNMVDHAEIVVEVKDGVVVLSGTVPSAAERDRAIQDASVAGVGQVIAEDLEVAGWTREERFAEGKYDDLNDAEIEQVIMEAIQRDPVIGSDRVTVDVTEGAVTLGGEVADLRGKRAAMQIARRTVGVTDIVNRIEVEPASEVSEEELTDRIMNALDRDPLVEEYELDVNVAGDLVYLYGTVNSPFEKAQAEDVVSRVNGVTSIVNEISIENMDAATTYNPYVDSWDIRDHEWYEQRPATTDRSDEEIAEAIRQQLYWSPFVDENDVTVEVEDGVVTLTGEVNSYSEVRRVMENVYQAGALEVNNNLEVG